MKKLFIVLLAAGLLIAATTPTLINNGKLQSDLNLGGFRATNGAAPSLSTDYATKGYVDSTAGGVGTVTSVAASVPSWLTVAGSPITSSGTLAITVTSGQTANLFLATPDGTTGAVGLRAIVAADIPTLAWSKVSKTGSSLADLDTRSAGDLSSGTLLAARMPAFTGDVTTSAGAVATTIANDAIVNAKVSSSAAIAWSKISKTGSSLADLDTRSAGDLSSGTLAAARFGTIQTTSDGGSHSLKQKQFIVLAFPHSSDGAGAIIYTNDNSAKYFGQAAFSGSAATNANFIEYRLTVPEDIDTAVDLKVERWKVRLGAADTSAQTYNIGMASVADSAAYDSPTLGQWVVLTIAADGSGASGDVETVSNVTLTSWKSNVTAGQLWVIRVNRDGAGDSSTQLAYSGPLVISYGSTQ